MVAIDMLRFVFAFFWLASMPLAMANDEIWVLIDTADETLTVKRGTETVFEISDIAIGRNGAGHKQKQGDDVTPKGHYRIAWFNDQSPYHRFFGLNYPSQLDAVNAYKQGLIDHETMESIVKAHDEGRIPPQKTPLGGRIGIHGLGGGDEKIHRSFNWTHGCIATTNAEIDRLRQWLKINTEVLIK